MVSSGLDKFVEYVFLAVAVLGLILSIFLSNLGLQIITIVIFGMIATTMYEIRTFDLNFPYVIMIICFVFGYLIAAKGGHWKVLLLFFIIGLYVGKFTKKLIIKHIGPLK